MTLYRHRDLEDVYDGPASAQSMLASSGWSPLSDEETRAYYQEREQEVLNVDAAMQGAANLDPSVAPRAEPAEPEQQGNRKEDTGE